jgi:hypothetical protein
MFDLALTALRPTSSSLLAAALLAVALAGCRDADSRKADPLTDGDGSGAEDGDDEAVDGGADDTDAALDAGDQPDAIQCPPPVPGVDYATQVQPLFDASCTRCHSGPTPKAGLDLSGHAGAASVVTACDCAGSLLFQKLGPNPPAGMRMPRGGPYLPDADIALICSWIDEGAGATHDPMACGADPDPGC